MIQLKYRGEKTAHLVTLKKISRNIVQVAGDLPVKSKGFTCHRVGMKDVLGDYSEYKTVYRRVDGGVQFSDDGSVYAAPVPSVTFTAGTGGSIDGAVVQTADRYENLAVPVPVPDENYEFTGWAPAIPAGGEILGDITFQAGFMYVETLDEVKAAKVLEMGAAQQDAIQAGIDITLTDGSTEHFTLSANDQISLMGLQAQVAAGNGQIPWHTSSNEEHCRYYSNADMQAITAAAMWHVSYHVTYFRDLRIYINSLETKEAVGEVHYGMPVPEELQSEVLKDMYAEMEG